jgi:hypothetical protein
MDWWCGLSSRVPALQARNPEFKSQNNERERERERRRERETERDRNRERQRGKERVSYGEPLTSIKQKHHDHIMSGKISTWLLCGLQRKKALAFKEAKESSRTGRNYFGIQNMKIR